MSCRTASRKKSISTTFLKYGEWKCYITLNLNVRAPAHKRVGWQQVVLPAIVQNGVNDAVMRAVGRNNVLLYLATLVMYSVYRLVYARMLRQYYR